MTPWEEYQREQKEYMRKVEEQKANAPVNKHAQEIAHIYISEGKQAALARLHQIGIENKCKDFEVSILATKVGQLLVNNGVILRKDGSIANREVHP